MKDALPYMSFQTKLLETVYKKALNVLADDAAESGYTPNPDTNGEETYLFLEAVIKDIRKNSAEEVEEVEELPKVKEEEENEWNDVPDEEG
jgi:hypothetical protein